MNTRDMADDVRLPGHSFTLGEMRDTIRKMRELNQAFYYACFFQGMGTSCHAFIEFCGLQGKFIDMCQAMLDSGIEFPMMNQHCSTPPGGMDAHHAAYLGEKFACIWGHMMTKHDVRVFAKYAFKGR